MADPEIQNMIHAAEKPYRCDTCNRAFASPDDKARHRRDKHTPHLKLSAKERPINLGPVQCGVGDCPQSFANKWNAMQHRRAAHGVPFVALKTAESQK